MARDKEELKAKVREQFPIIFLVRDPVEANAYISRRNALYDSAAALTGPPLSPDTTRYQTMLLTSSLIFLSFGLLNVSSFKLADATVSLDWKALFLYGLFLIGIGVVFAFKAYLDYDRAGVGNARHAIAIGQLQKVILVGQGTEQIEEYYWEQLGFAISDPDRKYQAKRAAAYDNSSVRIPDVQLYNVDLDEFRTNPELAKIIDRHEKWLTKIRDELLIDVERLMIKADDALYDDKLQAEKYEHAYLAPRRAMEAMDNAYAETLKPWVEMRRELTTDSAEAIAIRVQQQFIYKKLQIMNDVLHKVGRIRRWSFRLEIVMPLIFAACTILAVGWHVVSHGLPKPPPAAAVAPAGK